MGNENISFIFCRQCLQPDNAKQEMNVPIHEEVNNNPPEQIENNVFKEKKIVKLEMKNSNKGFNFVKPEEPKPKPKITVNNNIEEEVEKKKNNTDSKSTSFNAEFLNKAKKQSIIKQLEAAKKTEQNSPTNYQNTFKERIKNKDLINILIIGDKEVGKSVYALKEKGGSFDTTHVPTLWEETQIKDYMFNSHKYKLKFVNLSITESKEVINKKYEDTDIFLIMYDVTSKESFEYAKKLYLEEIKKFEIKLKEDKGNIFFIGNKVDLSTFRKVTFDESDAFSKENNLNFYEISVKTGRNCILLMKNLVSIFDYSAYPPEEEE